MQDDKLERLQGSALMGDIFRDAFCTIAVHCTTGDSQGFLESALNVAETVRLKDDAQENQTTSNTACFVSLGWDTETDIDSSPLSKRGWVLQERLLSTRIMHFLQDRILWENAESCKIVSDDRRRDILSAISMRSALLKVRPPISGPRYASGNEDARTLGTWYSAVEFYSRCDLTEKKDKLIAISGLAKQIQGNTGVGYYAGLWSDRMTGGLL